jgi:hypothetical protein
MQDFRLMVNRRIRFALEKDLNARGSLVKFAQSMTRRGLAGLRLDPDALIDDAMILLYSSGNAGAHVVSGRSGSTGRIATE